MKAQEQHLKSNDWFTQITKDLLEMDINMSQADIEEMSVQRFKKKLCKVKIKQIAFEYLEEKNEKHNAVKHIQYKNLEMLKYLRESELNISVQQRQYLFQCRVKDIDIRAHRTWKYDELYCITCQDTNTIEDIAQILACTIILNRNEKLTYLPCLQDLYSNDIGDQVYVSNTIREHMHIREELKEERRLAHVN